MARSVTFAGVELHPDGSVRYRGEWQNTRSCHAEVESVGQIRSRATVTRIVGGAIVAGPVGAIVGGLLRKRVDDREVYLLVTGDTADWLVPVSSQRGKEARFFAAALNRAAREAADREFTPAVELPVSTGPKRGVYRPGLR